MALEIEHKYLVIDSSYRNLATSCVNIRQGYLSRNPSRTVRIRIRDYEGCITVKGVTEGDTRKEYEYAIPLADAEELLMMCEPGIIDKTRYIVPYEGMIWEVDEFHDSLEGLCVAEIEIPSSDTRYSIPPFAGKNVTDDPAYYNSNL